MSARFPTSMVPTAAATPIARAAPAVASLHERSQLHYAFQRVLRNGPRRSGRGERTGQKEAQPAAECDFGTLREPDRQAFLLEIISTIEPYSDQWRRAPSRTFDTQSQLRSTYRIVYPDRESAQCLRKQIFRSSTRSAAAVRV